jgi:hypothetical protein
LDKSYELAKRFLEEINVQEVMQTPLNLNIGVWEKSDACTKRYDFEGSVVELFAQLAAYRLSVKPEQFRLLLEEGADFFDPSIVLLSFVGSHEHLEDCDNYCYLSRLLQSGTTANVLGYRVTPLQIAIATRDFEGVKILLEAGADPNGTGDSSGIEWKEGSLLARFNHLGGVNPVRICRGFDIIHDGEAKKDRKEASTRINQLLLEYEAKEA